MAAGEPTLSRELPEVDARMYLWIIYKRIWLIVTLIALSLVVAAAYLNTRITMYEAKALVRLEQKVMPFNAFAMQQTGATRRELPLSTAARLITSQLCAQHAQELIQEENPDIIIPVEEILRSIEVETTEPDLVEISCRSTVPERAVLIVNAVAQAFVDNRTQEARAEASQTRRFLEQQLTKMQSELARIQRQMEEFKRRTGIMDVNAQMEAILTAVANYESEAANARVELSSARSQLAALRARLNAEQRIEWVDLPQEHPLLQALKEQLIEKQVELIQLRSRYTDEHPDVQRVKDELSAIQNRLSNHLERTVTLKRANPNPIYDALRQQLVTTQLRTVQLEARERAFNELVKRERAKLTELLDKKQQWDQLQELASVTRETYKMLVARLQDAKIQEAAKLGDAHIADLASAARQLTVNRVRTLLFSAMLGLILGIGLAVLLEFLDTTIRSPEEVERLIGVKALALVPYIREERYQQDIVALMRSKSPPSEALRVLRSNLKFVSAGNTMKAWMITSTHAREGKTLVSSALGIALAQGGQRVVLLDADLRHPGLHRVFGLNNAVGLTSILVGDFDLQQALQPTGVDNLELLASGPIPPNPAELLDSPRMQSLIEQLKNYADVVVIDTPPAGLVTDPMVLATHADGVLLVLEPGRVSREALKRIKDLMEMAHGRIVGAVMNKITPKSSYYYYYAYADYYYYRYYRYYRHYYSAERTKEGTSAPTQSGS
ncbi:MAG TPA: polysaccharide biosynthesis tyrosine autokinase [Armatimonadetes bacterium]|nr:polysaccharide biosynthesis tyrosine autokinase [Armatimonadota bacterium]